MLTISEVTGWGVLDIQHLEKWIDRYAKIIGDKYDQRAISIIKSAIIVENDFPVNDINIWYKATITLLFHYIASYLKHTRRADRELNAKLNQLIAQFSPNINYLGSSFNNCLDYIDFDKSRDEILQKIYDLIIS